MNRRFSEANWIGRSRSGIPAGAGCFSDLLTLRRRDVAFAPSTQQDIDGAVLDQEACALRFCGESCR